MFADEHYKKAASILGDPAGEPAAESEYVLSKALRIGIENDALLPFRGGNKPLSEIVEQLYSDRENFIENHGSNIGIYKFLLNNFGVASMPNERWLFEAEPGSANYFYYKPNLLYRLFPLMYFGVPVISIGASVLESNGQYAAVAGVGLAAVSFLFYGIKNRRSEQAKLDEALKRREAKVSEKVSEFASMKDALIRMDEGYQTFRQGILNLGLSRGIFPVDYGVNL